MLSVSGHGQVPRGLKLAHRIMSCGLPQAPVEIAPKQIVSTIAYNGHFPGPLLRFEEGRSARAPLQKIPACCRAILWSFRVECSY